MGESCKMVPPNSWSTELGGSSFAAFIPRKLLPFRSLWGSQPFPWAVELGDKSFLGKALKGVGWADWKKKKKNLGQQGRANPGAEVLLHSCIGFLWLPIEAPSGCQPTTEKRELQGEENSHEAPEVEVQPEKLQPGWDPASGSCRSAECGLQRCYPSCGERSVLHKHFSHSSFQPLIPYHKAGRQGALFPPLSDGESEAQRGEVTCPTQDTQPGNRRRSPETNPLHGQLQGPECDSSNWNSQVKIKRMRGRSVLPPAATVHWSSPVSSLVGNIWALPSLHTTRQMTAILKRDKYKNKKWNTADTWNRTISASSSWRSCRTTEIVVSCLDRLCFATWLHMQWSDMNSWGYTPLMS